VVTNEDIEYGYVRARGYPMYLYSFGKMYLEFYKHTWDEYYKDKFFKILQYIDEIRNDDWTWDYYNGKSSTYKSPLYNCMFSELFMNAYELTQRESYCEKAKNTVCALKEFEVTGCYNGYFYAFVAIANYCSKFPHDKSLVKLGEGFYEYGISGYNPITGEWFYQPSEKEEGFYDGHAAYYELWLIQKFLEFEKEIGAIYPEQHSQLVAYVPAMMERVSQYVLPSGTFWYTEEVPDYTESAGITLLAYELYDDFFGTNHEDIKEKAEKTILERQAPCGAYYKTTNSAVIEIWYSDNIAESLPKYLNLQSNLDHKSL